MMTGDELEEDEAEAGAEGEGGVEEPEGGGGHRFEEAADPADDAVAGEEGQIVEADDGGVDRFGRKPGEEGEANGQEMREGDAVDDVETERPEEADLFAGAVSGRGGDQAHGAADGEG